MTTVNLVPARGVARLIWRTAGATIVFAGLALSAVAGYTAHRLAIPEKPPLAGTPGDIGLAYEDVVFRSRDGLTLRGWYLAAQPSESNRTVILVHGQNNNRGDAYIRLIPLAGDLTRKGYNVLAFDLRAHGESEGTYRTFGDLERRDLKGAVDYLVSRGAPAEWVGAIGFSLGAATVLMTAPEEPRIRAVVADSSYADFRELLDANLDEHSGLPEFMSPLIILVAKAFIGDMDAVKPERVIDDIAPRPLLIVHGTVDDTVPLEHAYRLAAAHPPAELWILEGVNHVAAYKTDPQQYVGRVLATFARAQ